MSKVSKIERTIPSLYRRTALSQYMFAFVLGVRATLHTVTVKDAISMFMKQFNLTEEQYSADSAMVTYNRMFKELLNIENNEKQETKADSLCSTQTQ